MFKMNGKFFCLAVLTLGGLSLEAAWPAGATHPQALYVTKGGYIDTGVKPNHNTRVIMDVTVGDSSKHEYWFGMWNEAYNKGAFCFCNDGKGVYYGYCNQGGTWDSVVSTGRHTVELNATVALEDGARRRSFTAETLAGGYPIYLFAQNRKGVPTPGSSQVGITFHACRIYVEGELRRDLVPCQLANGTICLYDQVAGTTLSQLGSGSFSAVATSTTREGATLTTSGTELIVDTAGHDISLDPSALYGFTAVVKRGEGTLSFTGFDGAQEDSLTLPALTVEGGSIGTLVSGPGKCQRLAINGTLQVATPMTIPLPKYLPAGEYNLISASAISVQSGAEIKLATDSFMGAGTTLRTLTTTTTGVKVTVTGDVAASTLPEGYTLVPYLRGTGPQYIDTGYIHKANTKVEAVVNVDAVQPGSWAAIFGSRRNTLANNAFIFFSHSRSEAKAQWNRSGAETPVESFPYGQTVTLTCAAREAMWTTADGTVTDSKTAEGCADWGANTFYIFDLNKYNGYNGHLPDMSRTRMKLYSFRIWEDELLVRDYVPCRNANGELGLYEFVTGSFFQNCGTDRFYTEGEEAVCLSYIQSSGSQWIDSGVPAGMDLRFVSHMNPLAVSTSWGVFFGAVSADNANNGMLFRFSNSTANLQAWFVNAVSPTINDLANTDLTVDLTKNQLSVLKDGTVEPIAAAINGAAGTLYTGNIYLFSCNNNGAAWRTQALRLYDFKIYDGETPVRNFVPMRGTDGLAGLADQVNGGAFYANKGTGTFDWGGIAYTVDEATLNVHEGTLSVKDLDGYTKIRKVSANRLDASAVNAYPALTLESGIFSVENATAQTVSVSGILSANAGARLVLDIMADGVDVLTAETIDFTAVTSENPLVIMLKPTGIGTLEDGEARVFASATTLLGADAAKFKIEGFPAQVEVRGNTLVFVKKGVETAVWTGIVGNGLWSTAGNWQNGVVPEVGGSAIFATAAGGQVMDDIEGLSLSTMLMDTTAGAFTYEGSQPLVVQTSITNLSTAVQTFTMPMTLGIGSDFAIHTAGDMTFTTKVQANTTELKKTGAGKLTIDAGAFGAPSVVLAEGTTVFAHNQQPATSGEALNGVLNVVEGAQLDLNYPAGVKAGDATLSSRTAGKIVHLAGSGPDNSGAIVNNGVDSSLWFSTFSRIQLEGDTVVGGPGRIDLRNAWTGNSYSGRTWMKGPDWTFTSKVTWQHGFNFNNSDIEVGKLVAGENGHLGIEGVAWLNVPNGVELRNNSAFDLWASTINGTGTVYVGANTAAAIRNFSGTSQFNVPLVLNAGSTLERTTGTVYFNKSATVAEGAKVNASATTFFNGPLELNGTLNETGGQVMIDGPLSGMGALVFTGGMLDFGANSSTNGFTGSIAATGGTLRFGGSSASGVPNVVPPFDVMQDEVHFVLSKASTVGAEYDAVVAQAAAANKWVGVFTTGDNFDLTLKGSTWDLKYLRVSSANDFGRLVIDEGSWVTVANQLYMGDTKENPKSARIEVKSGGTLEFQGTDGNFRVGHWGFYSEPTSYQSELVVSGGTLLSPNGIINIGWHMPKCYMTLDAGQVSAKGLQVRINRNNQKVLDERFTQNGGMLELGASGLQTGVSKTTGLPHANFAAGTLKATADFTNTWGFFTSIFGTKATAGGSTYTIDLNGHAVTWNTALSGSSDVTISGTGSFGSTPWVQGVPTGKWTVESTAATVDLSGAAGFAGGLSLAENARAKIDMFGNGLVEFGMFKSTEIGSLVALTNYVGSYQYVVDSLDALNAADNRPGLGNNYYMAYRGQFLVPEGESGNWSFIGMFDDVTYLEIDGEQIGNMYLDNNWTTTVTGSKNLSVGWHDFRIAFGQHTGGWGPSLTGKNGKMGLGWSNDPTIGGSLDAGRYMKFDTTTLKMRVGPGRWQHDTRFTSNSDALSDWMEPTTNYNDFDRITSAKYFLCTASIPEHDSMRNRLTGYVYIPKTGTWKVHGKYDDKFSLRLDGQLVTSIDTFKTDFRNDNVPLREGWHSYDIQLADTYGGWGPNDTDANGQRCSVAFCAPGENRYLAFTEENFEMTAYLPGLGGVTTLAAGSSLENVSAGFCPIYGTLEGAGALVGNFAFTADGCWRVVAKSYGFTALANTDDITSDVFVKDLRNVELVLTEKPLRSFYALCAARSLTDAEAAEITIDVRVAEGVEGVEVSEGWKAAIRGGQLGLVNPRPQGFVLTIR